MKNKSKKIALLITLFVAVVSSAIESNKLKPNTKINITREDIINMQTDICPKGWNKVFDISHIRNKWSENAPVVTCKPKETIMNCPEGTYFYIKGNENVDGYKNGEIGCHTPVW